MRFVIIKHHFFSAVRTILCIRRQQCVARRTAGMHFSVLVIQRFSCHSCMTLRTKKRGNLCHLPAVFTYLDLFHDIRSKTERFQYTEFALPDITIHHYYLRISAAFCILDIPYRAGIPSRRRTYSISAYFPTVHRQHIPAHPH